MTELPTVSIVVDGQPFTITADGRSLMHVLREEVGAQSVKDGCSPQGQCGCCTVLVDGAPRVSCVTPIGRMNGRTITTVDGLDAEASLEWSRAFSDAGASQCGFCTPGIICRLEGLRGRGGDLGDEATVDGALKAHLCRCTGWNTIRDAAAAVSTGRFGAPARDLEAAARRAEIEGGAPQRVGPDVALGRGGFADDVAPDGCLVAVPDGEGGWSIAESVSEARTAVAKVQGRRTTLSPAPPIEVPPGEWAAVLQTSWVEPAYLETDVAWCSPGGVAVGPLLNGGAFGSKSGPELASVARRLADAHGRPVRVVTDREWVVRNGPKRPPVAAGVRPDGSGIFRVARTSGIAEIVRSVAPELRVEEIDVAGPPTSALARAAGWAEVAMIVAGLGGAPVDVVGPGGGVANAKIDDDGVRVDVWPGEVLDETVVRSYVIGAAHMALGWVRSESIAVDKHGAVHDLTIRSFGVLRASEMPGVEVVIHPGSGPAVGVSDAAFAAVAAAAWLDAGTPQRIPCLS